MNKIPFNMFKLICCFTFLFLFYGISYSFPFISEETELAMGKGADKEITEGYGIYSDKSLQVYVDQI